jgi:hypothetical protein
MKPPHRLLSGIAWLLVPLAVTAVEGQDPQHAVARDFECLAAPLRPLVKINFEDLPRRASSCPDVIMPVETLPNPLEISGVKFTDPWCLATGFCSAPTCSRDEDNPYPGNIVLSLNPGGAIDFPPGTGSAILDLQGIGSNPFTLRATDVLGGSAEASASGELFGVIFVAFTSSVGLSRIEIVEVGGTGGGMALAAVYFGQSLREAPPPDCREHSPESVSHLRPVVSGTIRYFPELGVLEAAPLCSEIQSTFFKTTEVNREFRRGFLEFAVPEIDGEIQRATLILGESRGWTAQPLPADLHEISYYPADLEVTADDFGQSTTPLDTFETDPNLQPAQFSFDVTSLVNEFRGKELGFRIKLALDPLQDQACWQGSEFGSLSAVTPSLEISTKQVSFLRGDPSADARVDLSDPILILLHLFSSADRGVLQCLKAADVDDSGALDVTDAVNLLSYQFLGGSAPREPFRACGPDATQDDLSCASGPPCP